MASERYASVVTFEFGKDSAEVAALASFAEFWSEQSGEPMPDPARGLLFGSRVPERWCVPPLDDVEELKFARCRLQLPATWHLQLEPDFRAVEPAEDGGRVFFDEASLQAELQAQLAARQQEQRRKDAVAREWNLPPRYEVEFTEDGVPFVVGPDSLVFSRPEDVPRPNWMGTSRKRTARAPGARVADMQAREPAAMELEKKMLAAAHAGDFAEAARLKQVIQQRPALPRGRKPA